MLSNITALLAIAVPTAVAPKSKAFNSPTTAVIPSKTFNSVAVEVTATSSFILGDVKVLFVKVSVDTNDTNVELAPAGSVSVFVTPALWGCAITICPC